MKDFKEVAMKTKNKLKDELIQLRYRVESLEERLCPCQSHQWVEVDHRIEYAFGIGDETYVPIYQCRVCGKKHE